jgi:hypothetical protein
MGFRREKKKEGIRNWCCCAAGRLKEMAVGIILMQMWVKMAKVLWLVEELTWDYLTV